MSLLFRCLRLFVWEEKRIEICIELTWHTPPTPLLLAPTLSAGDYRVSGGELKVSRQVGLHRRETTIGCGWLLPAALPMY